MALIVLASASGAPASPLLRSGSPSTGTVPCSWSTPTRPVPPRSSPATSRETRNPRRADQPRPRAARGDTGRRPSSRDPAAGPRGPSRERVVPARHPLPRTGPQPAAAVGAARRPTPRAGPQRPRRHRRRRSARPRGWPQPLIAASDLTLLVTRNSLPALAGARSGPRRCATSSPPSVASPAGRPPRRRGRPLAGGADRRAASASLHAAPDRQGPPDLRRRLGRLGSRVAEVYSHGTRKPRKFESSGLVRSYRAGARPIHSVLSLQPGRPRPHTSGGRA